MKVSYLASLIVASVMGCFLVDAVIPVSTLNSSSSAIAAEPCAANPCAAASSDSSASIPDIYSDPESTAGIAIRGYDTVAYFTEGQPVEGSSDYEYEWNGVTWRFSSSENLSLFASDPEAYAPQYGGYCAKAVSDGNLASIVPEAWNIVDGKLYLNYSLAIQQIWEQDRDNRIATANGYWPEILDTSEVIYYDTVGPVYF